MKAIRTVPILKICECAGYSFEQMRMRSRLRPLVMAKYAVFELLFKGYKLQLSQIARLFNLNHATVIHGLRVIDNERDMDAQRARAILRSAFFILCQTDDELPAFIYEDNIKGIDA